VFEPDAACLLTNSRFSALHGVVGDIPKLIKTILQKLGPEKSTTLQPDKVTTRRRKSEMHAWSDKLEEVGMCTRPPLDNHLLGTEANKEESESEQAKYGHELWNKIHSGAWKDLQTSKTTGRFRVTATDYRYCHPSTVLQVMSSHMEADDVLCVDTGDVTLWTSLCAVLTKGSRTLTSERLGTMGYGLCAGFVASLVNAEKGGRGVVVAGDGGIQMTINELGTVAQHFACARVKPKLLIIVFDNEALGRVLVGFEGSKGCELGPSPDFVALAKAYGGDGVKLTDPAQLDGVMKTAFASTGLFLIHALTDPTIKADMAVIADTSIKMMNSG